MTPLNRRAILLGSSALALGLMALEGCASGETSAVSSMTNVLTTGQTIDQALIKMVADANALVPNLVSTSNANVASGYLAEAGDEISTALALPVPAASASVLTQISVWFEDAMTLVTPVLSVVMPGSSVIIEAIDAAEVLLPVFESLIIPAPTAAINKRTARLAHRARPRVEMSEQAAMARLKAYLNTAAR